MWSILLTEKSEAFEKFKIFKAMVEKEAGIAIKILRTDRGGEFTSNAFNEFCQTHGIARHLTAPYSPQQNGVVERRNRTLLGMTQSILKHTNLPNYLWGEAVRHATYLINRAATRTLVLKTPYEAFKSRRPNIGHIRIFECIAYAKVDTPHVRKLDDRSRTLVHLGTEPGSKAYRLFDPISRKIMVSRDVVFDENKSWNWMSGDKETETFIIDFGEFRNSGLRQLEDTRSPGVVVNEIGEKEAETEEQSTEHGVHHHDDDDGDDQPYVRRSTRETKKPAYLDDYILLAEEEGERLLLVINDEPWNYDEAKEKKVWRDACEEEIKSIVKNKT